MCPGLHDSLVAKSGIFYTSSKQVLGRTLKLKPSGVTGNAVLLTATNPKLKF